MYTSTIRLPDATAELLREQAARNHRSLNAQIVTLIEAGDPRTPEQRAQDDFTAEVLDTQRSDRP